MAQISNFLFAWGFLATQVSTVPVRKQQWSETLATDGRIEISDGNDGTTPIMRKNAQHIAVRADGNTEISRDQMSPTNQTEIQAFEMQLREMKQEMLKKDEQIRDLQQNIHKLMQRPSTAVAQGTSLAVFQRSHANNLGISMIETFAEGLFTVMEDETKENKPLENLTDEVALAGALGAGLWNVSKALMTGGDVKAASFDAASNILGNLATVATGSPLFGAVVTTFVSFVGGVFGVGGGEASALQKLYETIMKEVKELVAENNLKQLMNDVKDALSAIGEEMRWVPDLLEGAHESVQLSYFLIAQDNMAMTKEKAFGRCIVEPISTACLDFQRMGGIELSLRYVELHFAILLQIRILDAQLEAALVSRMQTLATEYFALLLDSYAEFSNHRPTLIKNVRGGTKNCQNGKTQVIAKCHDEFLGKTAERKGQGRIQSLGLCCGKYDRFIRCVRSTEAERYSMALQDNKGKCDAYKVAIRSKIERNYGQQIYSMINSILEPPCKTNATCPSGQYCVDGKCAKCKVPHCMLCASNTNCSICHPGFQKHWNGNNMACRAPPTPAPPAPALPVPGGNCQFCLWYHRQQLAKCAICSGCCRAESLEDSAPTTALVPSEAAASLAGAESVEPPEAPPEGTM